MTTEEPATSRSGPSEPVTRERVFGFACFPVERIALLFGIFAGPVVAASAILTYRRQAILLETTLPDLFERYPMTRLSAGATVVMALGLLCFCILYLQLRARTRVTVGSAGVSFRRDSLLPFGLLGKSLDLPWSRILSAEVSTSRRTLFPRSMLVIRSTGTDLLLPLSDAWELGTDLKQPWMARQPVGGWKAHPLAELVLEQWKAHSRRGDEKGP